MSIINNDFSHEEIIKFLREEIERIIVAYPRQNTNNNIVDAQAFGIWFLHQEVGISYEDANNCILDDKNDCGIDLIWIDNDNHQIIVGQIEYDNKNWSKNKANPSKAIKTFDLFNRYIEGSAIPESLHEGAKTLWRDARAKKNNKYSINYFYITPKNFSLSQQENIKKKSGLNNFTFFTYDELVDRGHEFLDGQTGMSSFKLPKPPKVLLIEYDFGKVFIFAINVFELHKLIEKHEKQKRLKSLFAANVRSYLNVKKRSKEIGEAIRNTLEKEPDHFLINNNGITIQCTSVKEVDGGFFLERASISNGCQTVMNINKFFKDNEGKNPKAEVIVTLIELTKHAPVIASEIARSRNYQNPVDNRDLMANNPLLVTLHHRLFADKLSGSEKRYYLLRKQGEKQTLLKEEPGAKGKYLWLDADDLARCIAAVVKQDPNLSQQGTNDLFGKHFKEIFPKINEPTHSVCKYAYWLVNAVKKSFDPRAKWKGISDPQIHTQKDFKNISVWTCAALIHHYATNHYSMNEVLEKRFIERYEKFRFGKDKKEFEIFWILTSTMIDDSYRLLHALSKSLMGKKLPKSKNIYSNYEDLFKGPNYTYLLNMIKQGQKSTYIKKLSKSIKKFIQYLGNS